MEKLDKRIPAHRLYNIVQTASINTQLRIDEFGTKYYDTRFDKMAYDLLCCGDMAVCKTHVCVRLHISMALLNKWMKEQPTFRAAVNAGLRVGEMRWRQKLSEYAFKPSSSVNNTIIRILSANVYGIREEESPTTIVNVNSDPGYDVRVTHHMDPKDASDSYIEMIKTDDVFVEQIGHYKEVELEDVVTDGVNYTDD